MDRNDREKQILHEWGKKNRGKSYFQEIDKDQESYFVQREDRIDSGGYIREYGFGTLPEFMQELDTLWGEEETMEQIKKASAIAVMKNEIAGCSAAYDATEMAGGAGTKPDREDKLPMYIYNF